MPGGGNSGRHPVGLRWRSLPGNARRDCCSARRASSAAPHATGFLQLPLASAPQSPWIELSLADGIVVRVPQQNISGGAGGVAWASRRVPGRDPCGARRCLASLPRFASSCMRCRPICGSISTASWRSSPRPSAKMFSRATTSCSSIGPAIAARYFTGTATAWWSGQNDLERGSFQVPGGGDAASLAIEIDGVTLAMMLGGVDLKNVKRRKRYQAMAG